MICRVYDTFMKTDPKAFWRNWFDSRFYIAYLVSKLDSKLVLDIGCSTGVLLSFTNAQKKIGFDYSFTLLQSAKKLEPNAEFICGDAASLPFRDNIFPNILAVQIFPELKKYGKDWKKSVRETKRVAGEKCTIILSNNNRMSRHFSQYDNEGREKYLNYKDQMGMLKDEYKIEIEGYDPHPKWLMFIIKKILFNLPDKVNESLFEQILFKFLRSKRYLKNGRSFVMIAVKKNNNSQKHFTENSGRV
jgi:SAM-dependent methyltransferase